MPSRATRAPENPGRSLLEWARLRGDVTVRALGALPFEHASGSPRTTLGGEQRELSSALNGTAATSAASPGEAAVSFWAEQSIDVDLSKGLVSSAPPPPALIPDRPLGPVDVAFTALGPERIDGSGNSRVPRLYVMAKVDLDAPEGVEPIEWHSVRVDDLELTTEQIEDLRNECNLDDQVMVFALEST